MKRKIKNNKKWSKNQKNERIAFIKKNETQQHHINHTTTPQQPHNNHTTTTTTPLRGPATLVVVEGPSTQRSDLLGDCLGKPGAGQGSPLRVAPGVPLGMGGDPEPCTERYWSILLHRLGQRSRTPRLPNHRLRLQDARVVSCSLDPCNTSRPSCLTWGSCGCSRRAMGCGLCASWSAWEWEAAPSGRY